MKGFIRVIGLTCLSSWGIEHSFSFAIHGMHHCSSRYRTCSASSSAAGGEHENVPNHDDNDDDLYKQLGLRINEIQVETTRASLEKAHTQSFLKRKPIKLPYKDARRWVQANLGCETEEEWYDSIANGHLRTPYIPKQPERYYTQTREWISWDHFLRGCFDNNKNNNNGDGGRMPPSEVKPWTGVFD
jgi:hypothetical protein